MKKWRAIRGLIAALLVLAGLVAGMEAMARGGQAADDCPPGSRDPDCQGR